MVKAETGQAPEQRINAVAERIQALDIDLRELSWARVREIAAALASGRHSAAECQAFARELDSIALTNLTLVSNLREASASPSFDYDELAGTPAAAGGHVAGKHALTGSRAAGENGAPEDGSRAGESAAGQAHGGAHALPDEAPADDAPVDRASADNAPAEGDPSFTYEVSLDLPLGEEGASRGNWDDDTAPVNVVQMLNAEMVYQSEDEHDKDRYAAAAAQASLYDDPVAVVLPSAEELEQVEDRELREEVAAEQAERSHAKLSDTERTPIAKKGTPAAPGAGGTKPADPKAAEGEPSISVDFSGLSRAERAILADKERKEERKRRKQEERRRFLSGLFGRKEEAEAEAVVIPRGKGAEAPGDLFREAAHRSNAAGAVSGEGAGKGKAASSDAGAAADDAEGGRATASTDPATFELFHTSNDGKVSFFRDADGHITAVNTNRMV